MITKVTLKFDKYSNLKWLGKRQKDIIRRMCVEGLVIRSYTEHTKNSSRIYMQDECGDNTYENISVSLLQSLRKKKIFYRKDETPSINVTVSTWKMKSGFIEETLLNL